MDPQTCSAIRELLARYAARQLAADERTAVEHHIATCLDCRTELREWLMLDEWLAQADAALPRDTDTRATRSLAAIHSRLDQLTADWALASRTIGYDLEALTRIEDFEGLERSALSSMHNHDSVRSPIVQQADQSSLTLHDGSRSSLLPEAKGAPSRPYRPRLPQRRAPAAVAWASVLIFLTLFASLFYLLAPQLHPHQNATNRTATATANLPVATRLDVVRTSLFVQNQISPFTRSVTDPAAVTHFLQVILSYKPYPPGWASACPLDLGIAYQLTFWQAGGMVEFVTLPEGGCPHVDIGLPNAQGQRDRRQITDPETFWQLFAATLQVPLNGSQHAGPGHGSGPVAPTPTSGQQDR